MTDAQKTHMTKIIAKELAKLEAKGLTGQQAFNTVFEGINKKWPLAMAAYLN